MGIQEVKRGGVMPEYPNTRKSEQAEGFQERLRQNMKYRNQEKEDIAGGKGERKVRYGKDWSRSGHTGELYGIDGGFTDCGGKTYELRGER